MRHREENLRREKLYQCENKVNFGVLKFELDQVDCINTCPGLSWPVLVLIVQEG